MNPFHRPTPRTILIGQVIKNTIKITIDWLCKQFIKCTKACRILSCQGRISLLLHSSHMWIEAKMLLVNCTSFCSSILPGCYFCQQIWASCLTFFILLGCFYLFMRSRSFRLKWFHWICSWVWFSILLSIFGIRLIRSLFNLNLFTHRLFICLLPTSTPKLTLNGKIAVQLSINILINFTQ